jgi:hypothetical protein
MKKRMQIISALLLSVSLLFPSNTAFSQDNREFDDYTQFIWEIMTINALGGDSEAALSNIRDATQARHDNIVILKNSNRGKALALQLEEMIKIMDASDRREREQKPIDRLGNVIFVIHAVLEDGADSVNENSPSVPNPVIAKILPVLQKQTKQNAADTFYGHIASQIPNSGSAISSSSSQIYDADAGLPPPSAPPVVAQDDTPTVEPSAPTLVPTMSSAADNGNSGGSDINIRKPLRFTNKGLYDATVLVSSYTPAAGVTAGMSSASTVVFRESNSSAYLDLPLGTYVFCYYWDLGTDVDNDGYVDYAHRNTGNVTLSATSSDNTTSAQVVTLTPENMNNPNGKCGVTQPLEDAGDLTPQELANQGTHTYKTSCTNEALGSEAMVGIFNFAAGGVNVTVGDDTDFYQRIDVNTYDFTNKNADQSGYVKITFTDLGFTSLYILEGVVTATITCTSLRK